MKYPIVGLAGKSGVGKDTVALILKQDIANVETVSFAKPLKEFVKDVFHFTDDQVYGNSKEVMVPINLASLQSYRVQCDLRTFADKAALEFAPNYGHLIETVAKCIDAEGRTSPRKLLQSVGTEYFRHYDAKIWVKMGLRTCDELLNAGANLVIITDCRFRDEMLAIKKVGGVVIKLLGETTAVGIAGHKSEADIDSVPNYWFGDVIVNKKGENKAGAIKAAKTIQLHVTNDMSSDLVLSK